MMKAIPIHQAKTNLSKYIQEAKAGKTIYIGSFGKPEVILTIAPRKQKVRLGAWKNKPIGYKDEDIMGPDLDIIKDFEDATNKPLPE